MYVILLVHYYARLYHRTAETCPGFFIRGKLDCCRFQRYQEGVDQNYFLLPLQDFLPLGHNRQEGRAENLIISKKLSCFDVWPLAMPPRELFSSGAEPTILTFTPPDQINLGHMPVGWTRLCHQVQHFLFKSFLNRV